VRNKRIDEFRIAHAFGAIAALVALYGIWLAAAAWIGHPTSQAHAAQAPTFWTAPAARRDPAPIRHAPRAESFWAPRAPGNLVASPQRLAGDFFGAREQL